MALKTGKNLLQKADTYNAYYGDFRGVDFSSDHTQVLANRFAYAVNMFKDYKSGQGGSIDTLPGFRRVVETPNGEKINAIHELSVDGEKHVLVHAGTHLYRWDNFPDTAGVNLKTSIVLTGGLPVANSTPALLEFVVSFEADAVTSVSFNGEQIIYSFEDNVLTIDASNLKDGDTVEVQYKEAEWGASLCTMANNKSVSFSMNGKGYILDGEHYLVYDGDKIKPVVDDAYVPTTRIGIVQYGDKKSEGTQYEQRNLLQDEFKQTFSTDGKIREFVVTEKGAIVESALVNNKAEEYEGYKERVTFYKAPPSAVNARSEYYPQGYKGVVIDYDFWYSIDGVQSDSARKIERFYADGKTDTFALNIEDNPDYTSKNVSVNLVAVYGEKITRKADNAPEGYVVLQEGGVISVKLPTAPPRPEMVVAINGEQLSEEYFGVEIVASKALEKIEGLPSFEKSSDLITKCTMATVFDGRVFLSGNPVCPNRVFYCGRNSDGVADPSYFGEYDHFADGSDAYPIVAMMPVADVLTVLKGDTIQEGSIYYHAPTETQVNVTPKIYPAKEGLGGIGCLGACVNFLDDPVFVSRDGLSAIGQLSVRYERAIEHRSTLVDAKLTNDELSNAFLTEWEGYLLLFVEGRMYMADSRQRYADANGLMQYEWYYAEGIGVYEDQYAEYRFAYEKPVEDMSTDDGKPITLASDVFSYEELTSYDLRGTVVNPPKEDGTPSVEVLFNAEGFPYVEIDGLPYLCEPTGAMTGGTKFHPATCAYSSDGNLFFGTNNGVICMFNFDKRDENGEIPSKWYSFDGRTILSGCATKMDNCGIPHLTKNTVKKSMVVKTKTRDRSALKVKVRTNKNPYNQVARVNAARFDFENMDFADFSATTDKDFLFVIREKEKKWVEKQLYLFNDEFCKPFSLFYIAYRYNVAGKYKE